MAPFQGWSFSEGLESSHGGTEILLRVGEDGVALEGRSISTVPHWFTFWALNCSWNFLILQSFHIRGHKFYITGIICRRS